MKQGVAQIAKGIRGKLPDDKLIRAQDECRQEKDAAHETGNKDQAEYDKQLLTLSSAFLAVSLAFIKDVVPVKQAIHLWSLYAAFILVALCIFLVLFSLQFSIEGNEIVKRYWDLKLSFLEDSDGSDEAKQDEALTGVRQRIIKHAHCVKVINRLSGVLFVLGIISIVGFVISNLHNGAAMTNKMGSVENGQCIKTPRPDREERGANLKVPTPTPAKPQNNNQSDKK